MKVTIVSAGRQRYNDRTARWAWQIVKLVEDDAGTTKKYLHVIDPVMLHLRAAEYDIDPRDIDTLLDLILCEPHFTPAEDDPQSPDFLFNAPTVAHARTVRMETAKAVKARIGLETQDATGKGHPLDVIRRGHEVHDELHGMFVEIVRQQRARAKRAKTAHATSDGDYLEQYAQGLRRRTKPVGRAE